MKSSFLKKEILTEEDEEPEILNANNTDVYVPSPDPRPLPGRSQCISGKTCALLVLLTLEVAAVALGIIALISCLYGPILGKVGVFLAHAKVLRSSIWVGASGSAFIITLAIACYRPQGLNIAV